MKREFVLFMDAERHIATLAGKKAGISAGESERHKTRKVLQEFELILLENGREWPNESDYAEYRIGKPDNKTTQQNISRIERYFAWREKENTPMEEYVQQELFGAETAQASEAPEALGVIESESVQVVEGTEHGAGDGASTEFFRANEAEMTTPNAQAVEAEKITENESLSLPESETHGAFEAVKARKSRAKGEKKVPISVYLDGETYRVMNILSGLTHRSIGDIAASTLSEFAKKNAAKVDAKAAEVQAMLDAVKKAMANFTLEY